MPTKASNGILAARRAGIFCVAVPNALTRSLDTSQADLRLESLAEMGLEQLVRVVEGKVKGELDNFSVIR